jgi:hypothetical protein
MSAHQVPVFYETSRVQCNVVRRSFEKTRTVYASETQRLRNVSSKYKVALIREMTYDGRDLGHDPG